MPELPEVETTARALRQKILGRKIKGAVATAHQLFEDKKLFRNMGRVLRGDKFSAIDRHCRYLLFRLSSGRTMIAHLKMTGHFLVIGRTAKHSPPPLQYSRVLKWGDLGEHVRFQIDFVDGGALLFSDVRKFGRIWLLAPDKISEFFKDRKLAHDALSNEASGAYLHTKLKRNRAVKSLLLDQTVIAGIGNIYADEMLWSARLHPLRKGSELTPSEVEKLHQAMRDILKRGIKTGGTSIRDYRHPDGSLGSFQKERAVYQRAGEPCLRCKMPIKRIVVTQRGTHYCPKCQNLSQNSKAKSQKFKAKDKISKTF